jgi:two-component system sensor histidine kinase BaeS
MISWIRRSLSRKLFVSYLLVIATGMVVLALTVQVSGRPAFDRHLAAMAQMMGDVMMGRPMMGHMITAQSLEADLYINFQSALRESLALATLVGVIIAVLASLFMSQQIVAPLRHLLYATRRIAAGHYSERVPAPPTPAGDELTELAHSFNRMAESLEKAEALRRDLVANVAHELRTPLTSVKGYLEGLMDEVIPATPETYERLHREVNRLERLIDDLLELNRVEAGVYELHRQPVSVQELVRSAVERLDLQFREKGVRLTQQVPAELPRVMVDVGRIGQVLMNLLGNALQYTPAGGTVTISALQEKSYVLIRIVDTGVGIAPEDLPHIFERFYRADRSRSRSSGGSGIGLTIAKLLAEAHGGFIRAESAGLGKGSTFTLGLPIVSWDPLFMRDTNPFRPYSLQNF